MNALFRMALGAAFATTSIHVVAHDTHPPRTAPAQAAPAASIAYRSVDVDGIRMFYREAGPADAPALLLLHGFPSSSHMFRALIPLLADRYRVVAPDYPGFGFSAFPDRAGFPYTFERLALMTERFTRAVGLQRYVLYVQDYGAPVGFRLALLHPDRVAGLVIQNGNAYEEGFSDQWDALEAYWREPSPANRERLRGWLDAPGTRSQYTAGLPDAIAARIAPESWTLDWALLSRPGNIDAQLDLFGDYRTNVELYPRFQSFFRERRPPTLVVWGRFDPFFTLAGAQAYRRDLPDAELHILDAGHFALETDAPRIAQLTRDFLARRVVR
ncbi:MAG TPA: alpha/beta hydrolase [Nevskiaceae bacterium]|nr:alpha/beta hydrolase [Nevskiaceae bacterium]